MYELSWQRFTADLEEIPPEVWKSRNILLQLCNAVYKQNTIEKWAKNCIFPFPKKGDLRITKNYRDITLNAINVKVYNVILLNHDKFDKCRLHR